MSTNRTKCSQSQRKRKPTNSKIKQHSIPRSPIPSCGINFTSTYIQPLASILEEYDGCQVESSAGLVRLIASRSIDACHSLLNRRRRPLYRAESIEQPFLIMLTARGAAAFRLQGTGSGERRWRTCPWQASYALEEVPESLLRVLSKNEVLGVSYGPQGPYLARKPRQEHYVGEQERATPGKGQCACWLLA